MLSCGTGSSSSGMKWLGECSYSVDSVSNSIKTIYQFTMDIDRLSSPTMVTPWKNTKTNPSIYHSSLSSPNQDNTNKQTNHNSAITPKNFSPGLTQCMTQKLLNQFSWFGLIDLPIIKNGVTKLARNAKKQHWDISSVNIVKKWWIKLIYLSPWEYN
jgi:hypothetical protein